MTGIEKDINMKKQVVKLLERDRREIQKLIWQSTVLKKRSLNKLKFYNEAYMELVFKSIVRIQKWFRACR